MRCISIVVYLLQHIGALTHSLQCVLYALHLYCCALVAAYRSTNPSLLCKLYTLYLYWLLQHIGALTHSLQCVLYALHLYCCVLVAAYRSTNPQGILVGARIIFQPILTISLYRSLLI